MFIPSTKNGNGNIATFYKWIAGILVTILLSLQLFLMGRIFYKLDDLEKTFDKKCIELRIDLTNYVDKLDNIRHGKEKE